MTSTEITQTRTSNLNVAGATDIAEIPKWCDIMIDSTFVFRLPFINWLTTKIYERNGSFSFAMNNAYVSQSTSTSRLCAVNVVNNVISFSFSFGRIILKVVRLCFQGPDKINLFYLHRVSLQSIFCTQFQRNFIFWMELKTLIQFNKWALNILFELDDVHNVWYDWCVFVHFFLILFLLVWYL